MTKEGSIIYDTIDIGKRLAEIEKAKTPTKSVTETHIKKKLVICTRCFDRGWTASSLYPGGWRQCPVCKNHKHLDCPEDESI